MRARGSQASALRHLFGFAEIAEDGGDEARQARRFGGDDAAEGLVVAGRDRPHQPVIGADRGIRCAVASIPHG